MAQIKIIYAGVSSANQLLRKTIREMQEIESETAALKNCIVPDIQTRYQIAEQLQCCCRSSEDIYLQTSRLLSVAKSGLQKYKVTDSSLQRISPEGLSKHDKR